MRIKNLKRFITFIVSMFIIALSICLFISNRSLSHSDSIKKKTIYTSYGDTLWSIAKRYRTSVDKILRTNDIENADVISVGQKILIIR